MEGFRPGVVHRLGIDYDTIRQYNPAVVYCSISGFGQDGPYRQVPAHDINYLGMSGGLAVGHVTGNVGIPIVGLATGTTAAFVIASAVRARETTGRGRYIDLAMLDCAVVWSTIKSQHGRGSISGTDGGHEPAYGVFETSDGKSLTIAAVEDKFWKRLCVAMAWQDWANDPVLARYEGRRRRGGEVLARLRRGNDHRPTAGWAGRRGGEVLARLRQTIATRSREEWIRLFREVDVPAAPVNSPDEVRRDPVAKLRLKPPRIEQRRRTFATRPATRALRQLLRPTHRNLLYLSRFRP